MKNIITTLLVLLFVHTFNVNAQDTPTEKANILYNQLQYSQAIPALKLAFEKEKNEATKTEILFKIAECYRNTSNPTNAITFYNKALKANHPNIIVRLHLAEALKTTKKYDEAIKEYEQYIVLAPEDSRGIKGVESCNLAKEWISNPSKTQVKSLVQVNSKFDDFAAIISETDEANLRIYIGSNRPGVVGIEKDAWTGQGFTDIFTGTRNNKTGKWNKLEALPQSINTEANEGALTINKEGNRMFFTRCSFVKKENSFCKIYMSEKKGEEWGASVVLDLVPDSFSVGQPALSPDGNSLYFSSDMAGGKGGKDIWVATSTDGRKFSNPVNVENINTPWDEKWPYVKDDGTLFFASQGHTSIGGLDIFMLVENEVVNLKTPINSPADDFGIIFEDSTKGFLTSNRDGANGYDIYSFTETEVSIIPAKPEADGTLPISIDGSSGGLGATANILFGISGIVTDSQTGKPIAGTKVTITGDDGTSFLTTTDANGSYSQNINAGTADVNGKIVSPDGTNYEILMESPNYFKARTRESTIGIKGSVTLKRDCLLDPAVAKNMEIQLPYIEYDFNSANLRDESKVALNKLIKTMNDNPTIKIELQSHTDSRGSEMYNMKLSQGRAQSVVDYLIQNGIKGERLIAKGYGKSRLKISDDIIKRLPTDEKKEEAHQVNRRTAFSVITYDYTKNK